MVRQVRFYYKCAAPNYGIDRNDAPRRRLPVSMSTRGFFLLASSLCSNSCAQRLIMWCWQSTRRAESALCCWSKRETQVYCPFVSLKHPRPFMPCRSDGFVPRPITHTTPRVHCIEPQLGPWVRALASRCAPTSLGPCGAPIVPALGERACSLSKSRSLPSSCPSN